MDFSHDELRRDLREAAAEQRDAMRPMRSLLERAFGDGRTSGQAKADLALGGLARRRFLSVGGLSVATAAILAACGRVQPPKGGIAQSGDAGTTTTTAAKNVTDLVLVRTASSLEHSAIDVYDAVLALNVLPKETVPAATLFRDQHAEHAKLFEGLTTQLGGQPYTQANPAVTKNIVQPALSLIKDGGNRPEDIYAFAYALEMVAAETYQSITPTYADPMLRRQTMSVGGVENRHAAVLAKLLPNSSVLPPASGTLSTAGGNTGVVTKTTTAQQTTTTNAAGVAPAVSQVPGAFNSLTPITVVIDKKQVTVDALGPNSFIY